MENTLLPDERWNIIYGIRSHEEFMEQFKLRFFLKPEAAPDIHGISLMDYYREATNDEVIAFGRNRKIAVADNAWFWVNSNTVIASRLH
jgi:hypothetical protein